MKKIIKPLTNLKELIALLKKEELIYIQTHNFPDHDAIASAYSLQFFLNHFHINSKIVYAGEIQRNNLTEFINHLNIEIFHIDEIQMSKSDKIVIVDGSKGNKNVTDFIGDEVAVIDHHLVEIPEDVEFIDIRNDYGSCVSIIYDYIHEFNLELTKNVATSILTGISFDTALLTRGVNLKDLEAYFNCFTCADIEYVNYLTRNYIKIDDLKYYKYFTHNFEYHNNIGFCYFKDGCPQNMLGILSDFVLSLEDIDFVVLCAENENKINFSIRNELHDVSAAKVIGDLLQGIGFGGGHRDMAGGIISDKNKFDLDLIKNRVFSII